MVTSSTEFSAGSSEESCEGRLVVTTGVDEDGDWTPTDEITEIGLTQSFFCAQYSSFNDFSSSMRALF